MARRERAWHGMRMRWPGMGREAQSSALWVRMLSCGGLATRLPRGGVPSNRWRTADFRECGGLTIRLAIRLPRLDAPLRARRLFAYIFLLLLPLSLAAHPCQSCHPKVVAGYAHS